VVAPLHSADQGKTLSARPLARLSEEKGRYGLNQRP